MVLTSCWNIAAHAIGPDSGTICSLWTSPTRRHARRASARSGLISVKCGSGGLRPTDDRACPGATRASSACGGNFLMAKADQTSPKRISLGWLVCGGMASGALLVPFAVYAVVGVYDA